MQGKIDSAGFAVTDVLHYLNRLFVDILSGWRCDPPISLSIGEVNPGGSRLGALVFQAQPRGWPSGSFIRIHLVGGEKEDTWVPQKVYIEALHLKLPRTQWPFRVLLRAEGALGKPFLTLEPEVNRHDPSAQFVRHALRILPERVRQYNPLVGE